MLRDGIIKGTGYNKYNLRSIINHDINKWLHVDLNMGYTSTKTTSHSSLSGGNRGNSLLSAAYFTPAILRPYNDDGSYTSLGTTYSILSSNLWNPMILINETSSATRAHLSNIIAAIIWKPFRGFSFKPSLGVESNDYRSDSYRTSKYQWGSNSASVTSTSLRTIINENIANYTFDLGEDHDLNLMGGFTYQEYQRRAVSASGSDFLSDAPGSDQLSAAAAFGTPSTSYQKWTLISWLGRVNYAYKGRYLATFSIRADGSSRYSEGNKWGYFPSAALAWRISDEPFMRNIKQISNLKLRLGYGETGSTAIEPYATLNMLAQGKSPIGTKGVATYYAASTQLPSSLKWETTSQWNIGVDAGSGLVHTIVTTAANTHDITVASELIREDDEVVYGDSGYLEIQKRSEITDDPHLSAVEYRINRRPKSLPKVSDNAIDWERYIENRKSSVRCKVELAFRIIKCQFGYRKVVYRGLKKNENRLYAMFACANLYALALAGRKLREA